MEEHRKEKVIKRRENVKNQKGKNQKVNEKKRKDMDVG